DGPNQGRCWKVEVLQHQEQPYRAIAGDWAERRRQAFAAVQGLLRDG
ncbi:hypothetical protein ACLBVT_09695, partial [Pseudomonas aeruginosa]